MRYMMTWFKNLNQAAGPFFEGARLPKNMTSPNTVVDLRDDNDNDNDNDDDNGEASL
jgi:hypothetical protein